MLFGSIKNGKTYVAAASRTEELKVFGSYMINLKETADSNLFNDIHQPDFIELMQDEELAGYSIAYVFSHQDDAQAEEFCKAFNIETVHKKELKDKHEEMLTISDVNIDPYLDENADKRALGEIYSLEETDPWDARTPEQIAEAEQQKTKMEELKKAGKMSGDSFSAPQKKKQGVAVTDIYTTVDENGEVQIDHAVAVKFGGEKHKDRSASETDEITGIIADFSGADRQKRFSALVPEIDTFDDEMIFYIVESNLITKQMVIEPNLNRHKNSGAFIFYHDTGWAMTVQPRDAAKLVRFIEMTGRKAVVFPVNKKGELNKTIQTEFEISHKQLADNLGNDNEIYYRIDVSKKFINNVYMLSAAIDIIMKDQMLYDKIHYTGLSEKGGWFTSRRMLSLEQIAAPLKEAGMTVNSSYAVNDLGERLVEEGSNVEVIDTNAPEIQQPRPWNGRMEEFLALGDGDIDKAWKKVKGKELIFCALPLGLHDGTLIYITPAEYFAEHKKEWDGEMKIDHLITPDMKPVDDSVNTYRSRSREELSISQELARKGLQEHLFFNLYINSIL